MNKIASIIIIAYLTLTGCAGAFLVGAAAGGLVVYEKRPIETIHIDQNIRHQILLKFKDNPTFKDSRITAASFNKMVILIGQVPNNIIRTRAEELARSTDNIDRLYNLLVVKPVISMTQQAEDTWITTKVKSQLLATPGIKSGMIKVVTEDRIVYLLGKVSKKQSNLVISVVRRVPGVKQVIKIFDYNI